MSISDNFLNKGWLTKPDDFLIIKTTRYDQEGATLISYLIVWYSHEGKNWISRIIEDAKINTNLALEMINDGVRVISAEEFQQILNPNRPKR